MDQKMLLKNIDQEIELVLIKQKQQDLDSFVWGYHAYMDKQTPKVGNENVCLKSENENQHGKFAVAIVLEERILGMFLRTWVKYSINLWKFLTAPSDVVTGKRVNHGAGFGLEIRVQYRFIDAEKAVQWAEKNIKMFLKT